MFADDSKKYLTTLLATPPAETSGMVTSRIELLGYEPVETVRLFPRRGVSPLRGRRKRVKISFDITKSDRGAQRMIRTVLFDLDGTLTDSREGIVNSVKYTVEKLGGPMPDPQTLLKFIGLPYRNPLWSTAATAGKRLWRACRCSGAVCAGGAV